EGDEADGPKRQPPPPAGPAGPGGRRAGRGGRAGVGAGVSPTGRLPVPARAGSSVVLLLDRQVGCSPSSHLARLPNPPHPTGNRARRVGWSGRPRWPSRVPSRGLAGLGDDRLEQLDRVAG